jgi:hypothetical protein
MCQGGVEVRSALPIALMVSDILSEFRLLDLLMMVVVWYLASPLYLYSSRCSHLFTMHDINFLILIKVSIATSWW